MFSNWFLTSFRILLFPFALLYGAIIIFRNWLYDKGYKRSAQFGLPLICVGNLSVGGTGKSPMVELIVQQLRYNFKVATLSRGYKRKTRGYALANEESTALQIGDEPMLFHKKFKDVPVAVGEERIVAIPQLLDDRPETEVIVLDDAFQHRAIKAGFNILLTNYSNLYTRDFFLPTGDLRDARSSAKRAEIIVVTKCPAALSVKERDSIIAELSPVESQQVYFTTLEYGRPYGLFSENETIELSEETEVLLVTGIANPVPLKELLEENADSYSMMHYSDHHIFTIDDWKDIKRKWAAMGAAKKIILTTEKDAVRLLKFKSEINGIPFYVIPVKHKFLFDDEIRFSERLKDFIVNFKQPLN